MSLFLSQNLIIKNENINDTIFCPTCHSLFILFCSRCQNRFCEECKRNNLPILCKCSKPKIKSGRDKIISQSKFKCIKGCGNNITLNDLVNHYTSNCFEKKIFKVLKNEEYFENKEYLSLKGIYNN